MGGKHSSDKMIIACLMEKDLVERLDYYAGKIGVNRSILMRNCLESSIDDLKLMEVTGILAAVRGGSALVRTLQKLSQTKDIEALNP